MTHDAYSLQGGKHAVILHAGDQRGDSVGKPVSKLLMASGSRASGNLPGTVLD